MSEIQKRITELGSCFHSETVNCGRQKELDMVKGFAIIFMVWDHVSRELGGNVESPFGMFVDMILAGPFAAPMFMICIHWGIIGLLGIVRVFSWKDTIISMLPMTILSFVILFISSIATEYYQNWKKERKSYGNQIIR